MQTHFKVEWVPLPEERQGEWRQAIELIAEIMRDEFKQINGISLQYRLAWHHNSKIHHGAPLFKNPDEALQTKSTLESMFPDWEVWVEPVK